LLKVVICDRRWPRIGARHCVPMRLRIGNGIHFAEQHY
jgi:hypothetical protein